MISSRSAGLIIPVWVAINWAFGYLFKPLLAKLLYLRIVSVIQNKRCFIRVNEFIGPDRRYRKGNFGGQDRRHENGDIEESPNREGDSAAVC